MSITEDFEIPVDIEVGTFFNDKESPVGNLRMKFSVKLAEVDDIAERIKRCTSAFKAEWEKD